MGKYLNMFGAQRRDRYYHQGPEFESQMPPTNAPQHAEELQKQVAYLKFENNALREEVTKNKSMITGTLSRIKKLEETEYFANMLAENMAVIVAMCKPLLQKNGVFDQMLKFVTQNLVKLGRSRTEAERYVANVIDDHERRLAMHTRNYSQNSH